MDNELAPPEAEIMVGEAEDEMKAKEGDGSCVDNVVTRNKGKKHSFIELSNEQRVIDQRMRS